MQRKNIFLLPGLWVIAYCLLPVSSFSWGFFAHKKINQLAVFTLPPAMCTYYKKNIDYLSGHAVDADKRRYAGQQEACRHYIDLDHYRDIPFDSIPKKWRDAISKFSEDTLNAYGIVPWYIEKMMYQLTEAFKEENTDKILYLSANIGHYISDAHVPLHTTENYNGQLTNQHGIHGFWESRLPELFYGKWDFFVGRAVYIEQVNHQLWATVKESFLAKDSVLYCESQLNSTWPTDRKYSFENDKKVYSAEYSLAYNEMLNGMVERRMRQSVFSVGSFWYTAWVNAGQPDLNLLLDKEISDSLKTAHNETEIMWKTGRSSKGHDE